MAAALGLALLGGATASAHVLIVDTTDSKGAILHINPGDNPVAGERSVIIFDTDKEMLDKNSQVRLDITNHDGATDQVKTEVEGPLAAAEYVFPSRGVYQLTFTVTTGGDQLTFNYSQRVSRGLASSVINQPSYEWAKILLLATSIGMALLLILAFNNRRQIKSQSTF